MKPSPDPRIPLATALAAAILLAAGLFGAPGLALADVPNATDIATCNREAQERVLGLAGPPTSKDEAVRLTPPIQMTLEQAIAYIADDELVEVTPKSIRIRKRFLKEHERKKASREAA